MLSTSAAVVAAVTLAASPALAAGSQIGYAQKPVQPSTDLVSGHRAPLQRVRAC